MRCAPDAREVIRNKPVTRRRYRTGLEVIDMKRNAAAWLSIVVAFVSTGSVGAHHSLANYDTTQAIRVKGTIVEFHRINPHSFVYLEEKRTDGPMRRWAVE